MAYNDPVVPDPLPMPVDPGFPPLAPDRPDTGPKTGLKNCPFCKSPVVLDHEPDPDLFIRPLIRCLSIFPEKPCGIEIVGYATDDPVSDLVEKWNRRA